MFFRQQAQNIQLSSSAFVVVRLDLDFGLARRQFLYAVTYMYNWYLKPDEISSEIHMFHDTAYFG